jgi:hypothetical protein
MRQEERGEGCSGAKLLAAEGKEKIGMNDVEKCTQNYDRNLK